MIWKTNNFGKQDSIKSSIQILKKENKELTEMVRKKKKRKNKGEEEEREGIKEKKDERKKKKKEKE